MLTRSSSAVQVNTSATHIMTSLASPIDTAGRSPSRSCSPYSDMSSGRVFSVTYSPSTSLSSVDGDDNDSSRMSCESDIAYMDTTYSASCRTTTSQPPLAAMGSMQSTSARRAATTSRVFKEHRTKSQKPGHGGSAARDHHYRAVRDAKNKALKKAAVAIKNTGKKPCSELQRLMLEMVFREITPYPPIEWSARISIIIERFVNAMSFSPRLCY